jgi:hypothetical protein
MKYVTLIFFICSTLALFSQKSKYGDHGFKVGFSGGPDYCFRILRADKDQPKANIYALRQKHDIPKFGYHFGIAAAYQTNGRFSFESGLRFSNLGFKTRPYPYDSNTSEYGWTAVRHYKKYFLEIPLGVCYTALRDKSKFQFIAGFYLSPSIQIYSEEIADVQPINRPSTIVKRKFEASKFNLFAGISSGCKYQVNDKLELRLQPEFRIGLFRSDDGWDLYNYSHLWNVGLNIGAILKI